MRILILVPQQDTVSGNWVTAQRFRQELEGFGHHVTLHGVDLEGPPQLRLGVSESTPDVALLLHAYRSGKPWLALAGERRVPYVVMLTGTDVNQGLDDDRQRPVIEAVFQGAAFVVLHNPLIARDLHKRCPELAAKLRTLTPAITLGATPYPLRERHDLAQEVPLFFCAAGLRPVKRQLDLLPIFDGVANEQRLQLAFCGPQLDAGYSRDLLAGVAQRPWARYLGVIPPDAMASALSEVDVVVNNSQSEGLANALLEAATLGVPILAHNNAGNAAVVEHNHNGLLYDQPVTCAGYIRELLDPRRRAQLSRPTARYRQSTEGAELDQLLREARENPANL